MTEHKNDKAGGYSSSSSKDVPATPPTAPTPFENRIPLGAMDPKDVKPGYAPNQGSPKEGDPTKLANPENPNSPITVPSNPSNPANPPAMQSDKPASEQRIYLEQQAAANPPVKSKAALAVEEEKKKLLKEIGEALAEFDNRESSVPPGHNYWGLVNRLRGLSNP